LTEYRCSILGEDSAYKIVSKRRVTPNVHRILVRAPAVAKKANPGQFIIIRVSERGERIPITLAGADPERGLLEIYVAEVGASSKDICALRRGEAIMNLSGPLGNPLPVKRYGRVLCVSNGVFVGANLYLVKALREAGNEVTAVIGARSEKHLFLVEETKMLASRAIVIGDESPEDQKSYYFLTKVLNEKRFDRVFTIGSTSMQKRVSELTKPIGVPTTVSLFPVMVDGTGMCGACRVTVGGVTRFACADGPDFDGHLVDFDELIRRMRYYTPHEKIAMVLREGGIS
jgi:ferredoxin--NADP+ reductase